MPTNTETQVRRFTIWRKKNYVTSVQVTSTTDADPVTFEYLDGPHKGEAGTLPLAHFKALYKELF